MQIVIDIDDNLYTRLFDNGDEYVADMRRACVAIRKGTPLPKGHGRLIDADALKPISAPIAPLTPEDNVHYELVYMKDRIDHASTIIEADKEDKK